MSRCATERIALATLLAIALTVLPFVAADAGAQRAFRPADGTECLVVTGSVPAMSPRVVGSAQPLRESYGEGDELFVEGPGVGDMSPGQRLQFVRDYGEVRHPDTHDVIADAIGWLGFAEVVMVSGDRALVRVARACREIQVGEALLDPDLRPVADIASVPAFDPLRLVTPGATDPAIIFGELESVAGELEVGTVSTAARESYGQRDLMIMDQGTAQGWAPGDVVDLYRAELDLKVVSRRESYTATMLGVGVIVAVGDQAAAVLIVEGDFPVRIGDRVQRVSSGG